VAIMLQTRTMPGTATLETERLRAEIHRMADKVSVAVRQTALEGIGAAMSVAASGTAAAPKDATRVASELLDRAQVMQTEIDRFLAIAAGRNAA
jgi:hypothetical protein